MSAVRLRRYHVGAIWMRAVASACGYTPEVAKPLGLAYALASTTKRKLYSKYMCGDLDFAGLTFLEPSDGVIHSMGKNLLADDYDSTVMSCFADANEHQELLYVAIESAEFYTLEELDQTPVSWTRLKAAFGLRTSFAASSAQDVLETVRNR